MDFDRQRAAMVVRLQAAGYVNEPRVLDALRRVPRELFLPGQEEFAYIDRPQSIGLGQTISAPHMVGMMAEAIDAHPGMRLLEVGTGSGYHAAVVAELAAPAGKVWSVERFPELARRARTNLARAGYGADRVEVVEGDGSEGWPSAAPYDRAYLSCAAPRAPEPILAQLAARGKLLAPIGSRREQELRLMERTPEGIREVGLGGCVFVPLVGKFGFPETRWN